MELPTISSSELSEDSLRRVFDKFSGFYISIPDEIWNERLKIEQAMNLFESREDKERFCLNKLEGVNPSFFGGYVFSGTENTAAALSSAHNDPTKKLRKDMASKFTPQTLSDMFSNKTDEDRFFNENEGIAKDYEELCNTFEVFREFITELSLKLSKIVSDIYSDELNGVELKCSFLLRYLNYGEASTDDDSDNIRMGAHADVSLMTIISEIGCPNGFHSLQLKFGDKWISVPPKKKAILVQFGEILRYISKGQINSMLHRVIMPPTNLNQGSNRSSLIMFIIPSDDVKFYTLDGAFPQIHKALQSKLVTYKDLIAEVYSSYKY